MHRDRRAHCGTTITGDRKDPSVQGLEGLVKECVLDPRVRAGRGRAQGLQDSSGALERQV